ncbi:MAG TPA: hypothetical protein VGI26_01590 [Solirubrobacteraceae bacterium]
MAATIPCGSMPFSARRAHRLETWLWTGPLGHLIGGTLDFAGALASYMRFRLTGRAPR